jgi:hypothetical protein
MDYAHVAMTPLDRHTCPAQHGQVPRGEGGTNVRFDGLRDQTTLPADRLEAAFQHEDVMAVLPVQEPGSSTPTVLVATPRKLGVASLRRLAGTRRWVTRWAPWGAVRLDIGPQSTSRRGKRARSVVTIAGKRFRSMLPGPRGTAAAREFGRSLRRRQRAAGERGRSRGDVAPQAT